MILAGAGTVKTTTITEKISYMVEKENIAPSQILALTFSKEAIRNMREKVEKLLQGKEVIVKTFHSFCAELIKDHVDRCKVPDDFKIFEEMDSAIFIFRELGTDARTASLYANTIGKVKDLIYRVCSLFQYLIIFELLNALKHNEFDFRVRTSGIQLRSLSALQV